MKHLLLSLCLFVALDTFAASPNLPKSIDVDVDKLVALYTDGFGRSQADWRHLVLGPLFKSDTKDAVVFFNLAGMGLTNGHREYVAIFAQGEGRATPVAKERPYRLVASAQIGTRWVRTLDWKTAKISEGQIAVRGLRWREKDAGCCPTGAIEVIFTISDSDAGETVYPVLREQEKSLQRNK